jgi:polyferredoxin
MTNKNSNKEFRRAKKQVRRMKGFYVHAIIFVFVNIVIIFINSLISFGVWWFQWTTLGWGIGLLVHWLSVFSFNSLFDAEWEESKIKEILEKDK